MKKEARYLLEKSIDSAVVGIDHFNRLWDRGRAEAVLIFLDRAFELLMKAIIIERGGSIFDKPVGALSIGSSECLRRCVSNEKFRTITKEQAISIQNLNLLRDAAQHYIVSVSENQLYIYAQSAVSIYLTLIKREFGVEQNEKFPDRLSLVSTALPANFTVMMDGEFEAIKNMLKPGSRQRLEAKAKLRAFTTLERSLEGSESHHTDLELSKISRKIVNGEDWKKLFPGIKSIYIDPDGSDVEMILKITKGNAEAEGEAVSLVPEGTPGAAVVGVRRVNELGFYSMYFKDISDKVIKKYPALNRSDVQKIIKNEHVKNDDQLFKCYTLGKQEHKRYSPKALDVVMKAASQRAKVTG